MQTMVFAVPIMAQLPRVGQATRSTSESSSSEMIPAWQRPTNSRISDVVSFSPLYSPGAIVPGATMIEGMLTRNIAISMPGVILSHEVRKTAPSKRCACSMISAESAMTSRLGRE